MSRDRLLKEKTVHARPRGLNCLLDIFQSTSVPVAESWAPSSQVRTPAVQDRRFHAQRVCTPVHGPPFYYGTVWIAC